MPEPCNDIFSELLKSFIEIHSAQLKSAGVPEVYWSALCRKLRDEVNENNFFLPV